MSLVTHVKPESVWAFFTMNKNRLKTAMVCVAENGDTGCSLYLTSEKDSPFFAVYDRSESEVISSAADADTCESVARSLMVDFLFPKTDDGEAVISADEQEEIVQQRDAELLLAMGEFLHKALETGVDAEDLINSLGVDVVREILENTIDELTYYYGMKVRYPQIENGRLVEYPYEDDEEVV